MSITIGRAAAWFESLGKNTNHPGSKAMFEMAAAALREKAERENPLPLTLEELWQMNGEAVWLEILNGGEFWLPDDSTWVEVKAHKFQKGVEFWLFGSEEELDPNNENYGKTWICYRHKPKEVPGDV